MNSENSIQCMFCSERQKQHHQAQSSLYRPCIYHYHFCSYCVVVSLLVACVIWYDLVSYFGGLGMNENVPYKLMINVSSLFAIYAYQRCHRNAPLSERGENQCHDILYLTYIKSTICSTITLTIPTYQ